MVGVLGGQALLNAANEKPDSRSPSAGGGTTTTTTSKAAPATESTHTGQLTPPSTPPVARATPPRGMAQPNQQAGTGIV
ncbi:MAG: hypothetical protein KGJ06_05575 [Pseudomonadota bacterium]|nr:hypothetical protein [Pseudomonadota bacterium]